MDSRIVRLVVLLIGLLSSWPRIAVADMRSTVRNSCRILAKYKTEVWAGPLSSDRSIGTHGGPDRGCGFAQATTSSGVQNFALKQCNNSVGCAYISHRVGSGAYHDQWTRLSGWHLRTGDRSAASAGSESRATDAPAGPATTARWIPATSFDSLTQMVTVDFDSLRIVTTNDSAYQAVRVYVWIGLDETDSLRTAEKTFWSGAFKLTLGTLSTEGQYSPGDFIFEPGTDSSIVSAVHLTRTVAFDAQAMAQVLGVPASSLHFDHVQVDVDSDGGYGSEGPSPPPIVAGVGDPAAHPGKGYTLLVIRNPAHRMARIACRTSSYDPFVVSIHDVRGARVAVLFDGAIASGRHEWTWDGTTSSGARAPAGMYYATAESAGGHSAVPFAWLR